MTPLRTISGLTFEVAGPSLFKLLGRDLWLGYDGKTWFLNAEDATGHIFVECPSKEVGASMLACAIDDAREARQ